MAGTGSHPLKGGPGKNCGVQKDVCDILTSIIDIVILMIVVIHTSIMLDSWTVCQHVGNQASCHVLGCRTVCQCFGMLWLAGMLAANIPASTALLAASLLALQKQEDRKRS